MSVDPMSIATLASTGLSAFGAIGEGKAAYRAGMYDAAVSDENARLTTLEGAFEEGRIRREERALSGEAMAAMGASGVMLGTGSALELLRENAYLSEMDALTARWNAAGQARGYRMDAERARAGARDARRAGYMRAGTAILSGASQAFSASRLGKAGSAVRAASAPRTSSGLSMPVPAGRG
ncbi:MAG TPA: hypothetical protein VGB70_12720 [Allosphingosinicella sp.]|jgi:hypothetical protein